jgi:hypothetical protein
MWRARPGEVGLPRDLAVGQLGSASLGGPGDAGVRPAEVTMGLLRDIWDDFRKSGMSEEDRRRYDADQYEKQGDYLRAAGEFEGLGLYSKAADLYMRHSRTYREPEWEYHAGDSFRKAGRLRELRELMLQWVSSNCPLEHHSFNLKAALEALRTDGKLEDFALAAAKIGGFGAYVRLAMVLARLREWKLVGQLKLASAEAEGYHTEQERASDLLLASQCFAKSGDLNAAAQAALRYLEKDRHGISSLLYASIEEVGFVEDLRGDWWKALLERLEPELQDEHMSSAHEFITNYLLKPGRESDARFAIELSTRVHRRLPEGQESRRRELIDLWKKIGDGTRVAELRLEEVESRSWSQGASTVEWEFDALVRDGMNDAAASVAERVLNEATKLEDHRSRERGLWKSWIWLTMLGREKRAAEAYEAWVRCQPDMSILAWQTRRATVTWPTVVCLWEAAGERARAARIAREIGRTAKAERLGGRSNYRVEEIDFPRGVSRLRAVGTVLLDRAMCVEALLGEGQVDRAIALARDRGSPWSPGVGRAAKLLREHGASDEARALEERRVSYVANAEEAFARVVSGWSDRWSDSILPWLEDQGRWQEIVQVLQGGGYRGWNNATMARALYGLGKRREAAQTIEEAWGKLAEELGTPWRFIRLGEVGEEEGYAEALGLFWIWEEAGDSAAGDRVLHRTADQLRKFGLWQWVLGMYFDAGRLEDLERVAREEDELECAIIAHEAAGRHGEVARLYEEISGVSGGPKARAKTGKAAGPSARHGTESLVCACGQALRPNWVACPACGAARERVCGCGQRLDPAWKLCPVCGAGLRA